MTKRAIFELYKKQSEHFMAALPVTVMIRPCERLIKNVRFEAKPRQLGHIDPNLKRLISGILRLLT